MTPEETVTEFIHRIEAKDVESALELCTDDLEYDNVPMSKILGKQATLEFLGPFIAGVGTVEWIVHR